MSFQYLKIQRNPKITSSTWRWRQPRVHFHAVTWEVTSLGKRSFVVCPGANDGPNRRTRSIKVKAYMSSIIRLWQQKTQYVRLLVLQNMHLKTDRCFGPIFADLHVYPPLWEFETDSAVFVSASFTFRQNCTPWWSLNFQLSEWFPGHNFYHENQLIHWSFEKNNLICLVDIPSCSA